MPQPRDRKEYNREYYEKVVKPKRQQSKLQNQPPLALADKMSTMVDTVNHFDDNTLRETIKKDILAEIIELYANPSLKNQEKKEPVVDESKSTSLRLVIRISILIITTLLVREGWELFVLKGYGPLQALAYPLVFESLIVLFSYLARYFWEEKQRFVPFLFGSLALLCALTMGWAVYEGVHKRAVVVEGISPEEQVTGERLLQELAAAKKVYADAMEDVSKLPEDHLTQRRKVRKENEALYGLQKNKAQERYDAWDAEHNRGSSAVSTTETWLMIWFRWAAILANMSLAFALGCLRKK